MNLNPRGTNAAHAVNGNASRRNGAGDKAIGAHAAFEQMSGMYQRGEFDSCIIMALRFTKTWAQVAPGWQILAACLQAKGDYKNAEIAGRKALQVDDNSADTHNIYGCTLKELGHLQNAGFHFGRAIELKPHHAEAHSNLGAVLIKLARLEEAESILRKAVALKPDFALAHYQLGSVLRERDQADQAKLAFETALKHQPSLMAAHLGLGHLMTHLGDFRAGERHYRAAIALEPTNGALYYHLAFVKKFCADDPEIAIMTQALKSDDLSVTDKIYLHYAAGKAHDDTGRAYDAAFEHFHKAAQLHRAQLKFDTGKVEADLLNVERFFTASFLNNHSGGGHATAQPIFIVGMPRSGTTLVEQMLASHPKVHAKGERDDLAQLAKSVDASMKQPFPDWLDDLEPEKLASFGRKYMAKISAGAPNGDHITDKMVTNFKLLGLIALTLPNARVVHVRRHPLDTCLSCYCQPFTAGSHFSYDLGELGRYYQAYNRLMTHWHSVLPAGFLKTLDYENLVEAPEDSARALVSHCGLEWDAGCLDFQSAARQVKTASATQVRQKLYTSSMGRWRNYEAHLGPLVQALGSLSEGHNRAENSNRGTR